MNYIKALFLASITCMLHAQEPPTPSRSVDSPTEQASEQPRIGTRQSFTFHLPVPAQEALSAHTLAQQPEETINSQLPKFSANLAHLVHVLYTYRTAQELYTYALLENNLELLKLALYFISQEEHGISENTFTELLAHAIIYHHTPAPNQDTLTPAEYLLSRARTISPATLEELLMIADTMRKTDIVLLLIHGGTLTKTDPNTHARTEYVIEGGARGQFFTAWNDLPLHRAILGVDPQGDIPLAQRPMLNLANRDTWWQSAHTDALAKVEAALKAGADVNQQGELQVWTPLHMAAAYGTPEIVNLLLEHGATPNAIDTLLGETLLHIAAAFGNRDMTEFFLERGLPVNDRNFFGLTPLIMASRYGHINTSTALINHGTDVNAQDSQGRTSLHWAIAQHGNTAVVQLLLESGARVNVIENIEGNTPLHIAAQNNLPATVNLLIEHGADPRIRNSEGSTALDLAENLDVRLLLESALKLGNLEQDNQDAAETVSQ